MATDSDKFPAAASELSRLHQYLGVWAIIPDRFTSAIQHVQGLDLKAHIDAVLDRDAPGTYDTPPFVMEAGGVAKMHLHGAMTKYGSSLSSMPGTLQTRRNLRQASADESVRGIMLAMDSPGGNVSGVPDLAGEVRAVSRVKPVHVHAEDSLASAAYWVGSQATRLTASPAAQIGSIGVYAVVEDWSAMYAERGIKTHIIKSGKFKGAGAEGAEVTQEELDEIQRMADSINDLFANAVAKGRSMTMSQVAKVNDGRVWLAEEAQGLGLIDGVESFDVAMNKLRVEARPARSTKSAKAKMAVAAL